MTRKAMRDTLHEAPPSTSDTEPWWDATRDETLMIQRCDACANLQFYPRAICVACGSLDLRLVPASGRGKIYSFTVIERSTDPVRFPTPYVVALVRLEEGPMLLTNIIGEMRFTVKCDDPVCLAWRPLSDGRNLPQFTRDNAPED